MHHIINIRVLVLTLLITSILACSNPAMIPIPDEQRTQSNVYDGEWLGSIDMDNKYQRHGRYEWTCPPWRADLSVSVKNGLAYGKVVYEDGSIQVFTTNINDQGYFLGLMESADEYNMATGASRKIIYALRMNLLPATKQGKGGFVLSNGENGQGCTASAITELKS